MAVYVHVPFCTRRCHYCDFAVTRSSRPPIAEWLQCLERDLDDWDARTEGSLRDRRVDTVFVGGGTPSLLGGDGMERLADLLRSRLDLETGDVEWSAEANPVSLDAETARRWRACGVNRLSIGVQSFEDPVLRWLGRLHDGRTATEAVQLARAAGFDNVSVDLMFGLPGEVARNWAGDLERAVSLGTSHVSAYGLTAEPRTPLGARVAAGDVRMPEDTQYQNEYLLAVDILEGNDFKQYEVSNFARDGRECRHNWHYWIGTEYLGLGPSAHSLIDGRRTWNVSRWDAYREAARRGGALREGSEVPDREAARLEDLWLGLRTRRGVTLEMLGARPPVVDEWVRRGWAELADETLRLTARGWLRMDGLVSELARPASGDGAGSERMESKSDEARSTDGS